MKIKDLENLSDEELAKITPEQKQELWNQLSEDDKKAIRGIQIISFVGYLFFKEFQENPELRKLIEDMKKEKKSN